MIRLANKARLHHFRVKDVPVTEMPCVPLSICQSMSAASAAKSTFPSSSNGVLPAQWKTGQTALYMRDFADWPLLLLHRVHGAGQYERVIEECRRHGFEPNVLCECPDATILLSLVAQGLGATIVPQSTVALFRLPVIKVLEIIDSSMTAEAAAILDRRRYLPKSA